MKELEQKADELINKIQVILESPLTRGMKDVDSIQCAIQSVNHTIEVLEKVRDDISDFWYKGNVIVAINEQIELKKILEGRL